MKQPNPKYRSPTDLNARDREHYEVAKAIAGTFDKARFVNRYRSMYPHRNEGSMIPSDYCFNRDNKGNSTYPRFLEWDGGRSYEFVGMGSRAMTTQNKKVIPVAASPTVHRPKRALRTPTRNLGPLFQPRRPRPYRLDVEQTMTAIQSYNSSPTVLAQEASAFHALGNGFVRGSVENQLIALDGAYSTRSVHSDLLAIAGVIEADWSTWTSTIESCPGLSAATPDPTDLQTLTAFFLASDTRRRPRSLATKALHFARPGSFIPVDSYTGNLLGQELDAGSWEQTQGMDTSAFAAWYLSFLLVTHQIAEDNRDILPELFELDRATFTIPGAERTRGFPKLLDKVLWWVGLERKRGNQIALFANEACSQS